MKLRILGTCLFLLAACGHKPMVEASSPIVKASSPVVEPRVVRRTHFTGAELYAALMFSTGPAVSALPVEILPLISGPITEPQREFLGELEMHDPGFLPRFTTSLSSRNPVRVHAALREAVRTGREVYRRWKFANGVTGFEKLAAGGFESSRLANDVAAMELAETFSAN